MKRQILDAGDDRVNPPFENLIDVIETHARERADKVLYYFLEDGLNESSRVTFREFRDFASSVGAALQKNNHVGDRVIMMFPSGTEFIISLAGCFLSGMVGVPVYPPRKNRNFNRFESIMNDAEPSAILTTRKIYEDLEKNFAEEKCLQGMPFIIFEDAIQAGPAEWKRPDIDRDAIAIMQYTSGSTGEPNGVMVSHGNVIFNSEFIKKAFGHTENMFCTHWLPGFHDMGLIGALLQPLYTGGSNVIIPPSAFLMRPQNWLKSIGNYQTTTSGGPNFGYEFCTERIREEDLEEIRLETVRPLYCGSEPIRSETLDHFAKKFRKCGFSIDQFYPCYGLAENTLIATGGDLFEKPVYLDVDARKLEKGLVEVVDQEAEVEKKTLVGCGYPMAGTVIVIVNPESMEPCKYGTIGEIWIGGPSVAKGYWRNKKKTEKVFHAHTTEGEGPYLRTGDLGFIHDGQLYITGRIKDLIIIRGLNHYPHDIEVTVENSHEAIQLASSAAFSIDRKAGEELVIVSEIKRTAIRTLDEEEVFKSIREAVTAEHQVEIAAIALVRPGSVPKTSSGKLRRFECRNDFLNDKLQSLAEWKKWEPHPEELSADKNEILKWMKNWIAVKLKIDPESIDTSSPLDKIGLDSIMGVVMAKDAEEEFGMEWPIDLFLEETTLRKIARKGAEILRGKM